MHLRLHLPKVQPADFPTPPRCPFPDRQQPKKRCPGTHFKAH
jgi:hypothetical protein